MGGLWYSSPDFQKKVDGFRGKVSVFVDPDDVTQATVLVPGSPNPFEVQIQITAFADLALHEVLELLAAWRKEHPSVTEIHEDRIMRTRRQRFDQLRAIGVERKLPRSYSTFEECRTKATAVMAGARIVRTEQLPGTATVGRLTQLDAGSAVFRIGPDKRVIEGTPVERMTTDADLADDLDDPTRAATKIDVAVPPVTPALLDNGASSPVSGETTTRSSVASRFLGRPTDLKKPE